MTLMDAPCILHINVTDTDISLSALKQSAFMTEIYVYKLHIELYFECKCISDVVTISYYRSFKDVCIASSLNLESDLILIWHTHITLCSQHIYCNIHPSGVMNAIYREIISTIAIEYKQGQGYA